MSGPPLGPREVFFQGDKWLADLSLVKIATAASPTRIAHVGPDPPTAPTSVVRIEGMSGEIAREVIRPDLFQRLQFVCSIAFSDGISIEARGT